MNDNQYLEFSEYKLYGGNLDMMPFNLLEFKARMLINYHTFDRLTKLEKQNENVKMCMYQLISNMEKSQEKGNISNERLGNWSVTYKDNASSKITDEDSLRIIRTYLSNCKLDDGTPYLFRGV